MPSPVLSCHRLPCVSSVSRFQKLDLLIIVNGGQCLACTLHSAQAYGVRGCSGRGAMGWHGMISAPVHVKAKNVANYAFDTSVIELSIDNHCEGDGMGQTRDWGAAQRWEWVAWHQVLLKLHGANIVCSADWRRPCDPGRHQPCD